MDTLSRARDALKRARADLGHDLGGWSPVDLLLDQMPEIRSPEHARSLLADLDAEDRCPECGNDLQPGGDCRPCSMAAGDYERWMHDG